MDLAIERYMHRAESPDRHPGHLPEHQSAEAIARWTSIEPAPLTLDAPRIDVDTTTPVDIDALAARVVALR